MQRIAVTKTASKFLTLLSIIILSSQSLIAHAGIETENREQELSTISGHIAKIQDSISHEQARQIDLQQQLKISELQIAQISQQTDAINLQVSNKQTELDKIKKMQQMAQIELTKQQKILISQIRIIYQLKQSQSLKAVFDPGNLNRANRHLTYYNHLNNARAALMGKIKNIVDNLNKNIAVINHDEQNLQALLAQKQQQQHQLQNMQQNRQRIIASLNQRTYGQQQQLAILTQNQKTLQNMLSTLVTTPQVQTKKIEAPVEMSEVKDLPTASFKQVEHRLTWPSSGQISQTATSGVIIKAPAGTPVKAIYAGRVIFASWLRGYGLLVIINHGDGYMSLYARNQAIYRKVGEIVHPGDIVATIGNSGGFDQPSLYFEIRRNGLGIDPHNWCA
jgi:septal ring factor EnvC (AmiA/AmiB activator)